MDETVGDRIHRMALAQGYAYGEEFAGLVGVSYETLRKWRTGAAAPNRKRQERLSELLKVPPAAFMFGVLSSTTDGTHGLAQAQSVSQPTGTIASMDEPLVTVRDGVIAIPLLSTAGSMGLGADQHDEVVVGRLSLKQAWVGKTIKPITQPENLRFIHGYGDSMAPTFNDGDVLLVDGGVRSIVVDGVYVLEAQSRLYIKRVRQRFDGRFEVSSDNPTVKTVDVLDGDHQVDVLGKVVWIWNGKKV